MKHLVSFLAILVVFSSLVPAGATAGVGASQATPTPSSALPTGKAAQPKEVEKPAPAGRRAEAYYHFTLGHFYAELYELGRRSEDANLAIEHYKKAYDLDPESAVISEQLAEIYAKAQRVRDAVLEAQEILKRDPDNLPARRLLARIYVRTLGELKGEAAQRETLPRAIEQYREILRVEPGDREAALWLARLYRLQNEHEKAEEILRRVLEREPENDAVLDQLTRLWLDVGKTEEAIHLLEPIAARAPRARLLALLGDAYAQKHEYGKAEQAFRRAVELEPADAEYHRKLAQALLGQEQLEQALEQFKRLAEIDPDDPENYLRMAQIYRHLKKLDAAEENLLRAKQRAPGNLEVSYNEALIDEAQGRFHDAIRVLSDAVASVKANSERPADSRRTLGILYEQLGRLYREVENFTAALHTFEEMKKLGKEEEKRAWALIMDTYRASKEIGRALAESRKALEFYPQDRGLQLSYALLVGENGETDEAAKLLRRMLTHTSQDREIHLSLAQVYERGRRYDEAEQAARLTEESASQPAENEMVWFLLGAIYERQKKYDLAEEQFKKVLQVNPHNAAALNYYGYMLAERGIRLDEASELVKRALAEEPYNGAYLDSLGWTYFKQNRLVEAEEYLLKAVGRISQDPTIRDHLGDVYYKTGQIARAAAEWEKALAEWRRSLPTEYEADRVAELEKKLTNLKNRLAQTSASQPKPE
jgi:tetratricopeptide (TPR) repeat protein